MPQINVQHNSLFIKVLPYWKIDQLRALTEKSSR